MKHLLKAFLASLSEHVQAGQALGIPPPCPFSVAEATQVCDPSISLTQLPESKGVPVEPLVLPSR